jgi:hypothetical protein
LPKACSPRFFNRRVAANPLEPRGSHSALTQRLSAVIR